MMDLESILTKKNVIVGAVVLGVGFVGYVVLNKVEKRVYRGILVLDSKEEQGILTPEEQVVYDMIIAAFDELEKDELNYYPFIFKVDKLLKSLESIKKAEKISDTQKTPK